MVKRLILFGLVLGLSGCATIEFKPVGDNPLLATLSKVSEDTYQIESISNTIGNVDLNNGNYLGDRTGIDCRRVVCGREAPDFFRSHNVHPEHDLGNGLGKGYDMSVSYKRFDYSDHRFKSALEKALLAGKIDRDKLLKDYDVYIKKHGKADITLSPDRFNKLISQ
jgi:hypothetical protein